MCGIVGIISKQPKSLTYTHADLFKEMLICDSIRGEDSTGIFSINDSGNASFLKLATHPFNLINSKEYKDWADGAWANGRAMIGHNRKATEGIINNSNTHPFIFGNILLIHNGNISNFRSLLNHWRREKLDVEVDSHAACVLLAENEPEKILKEMVGAFTFVWYDVLKKKLFFIRNEERPLAFANTPEHIYFASEDSMLEWLLKRKEIKATITNLKSGVLFTMDLTEDLKFEHKKIELFVPKVYQGGWSRVVDPKPLNLVDKNKFKFDSLFESQRHNIHYGQDQLVIENEIEFQQIIFSVEDYKQVGNSKNIWTLWGHALDSESILCIFTFIGTDKEVEELAYKSHLAGFIKRIKEKKFPMEPKEQYPGEYQVYQEIILQNIREVEMTTTQNGVPITTEHLEYLERTSKCQCGNLTDSFDKKDLLIERNGFKNELICKWCNDKNEKIENPTL